MNTIASANSTVFSYAFIPISVTFSSGSPSIITQNNYTLISLLNTGTYSFTLNGCAGKTIYFCVVGGGSGGGRGQTGNQWGGSGGSGGQVIYGSYVIVNNNITCSATVGPGGMPSYYGNAGRGTAPVSGYDNGNTTYGTTTANDFGSSGDVYCSGGFSILSCSNEWTNIKALGGVSGITNTASFCSSTGYSLGTNTAATFYQGKSGGAGVQGNTTPNNGITGYSLSIAGNTVIFSSSAGGSQVDQTQQSTSGTNAGKSSGSSGSYTGWSSPGYYDGFPGTDNTGSGGGGGSGSGGNPNQSSGANFGRQAGGYGGSGVIYIWY